MHHLHNQSYLAMCTDQLAEMVLAAMEMELELVKAHCMLAVLVRI